MARPAGSLPWTDPTTRIFVLARGLPTSSALIGRPSAELPIVSAEAGSGAGAAAIAATPAKNAARDTAPEYYGRTLS